MASTSTWLSELFLLLFADDLAPLSSTALGLQNQLNYLNSMRKEHSLSINTEKCEVLVFRWVIIIISPGGLALFTQVDTCYLPKCIIIYPDSSKHWP